MKRIHNWINSGLLISLYIIVGIALFHSRFNSLSINWFSNGSIIENAYYVSGVLTLFAVLIAYFSLKISKTEADDRRNREISDETIKNCNYYVDSILPQMDALLDTLPKYHFFNEDFETVSDKEIKLIEEYISELNDMVYESATKLLNKIEGFSLYFTKGYHDKKIANQIISNVFCIHVKALYPFIKIAKEKNAHAFDDVVKLYLHFRNNCNNV